jgi:hypothetical protein
MSVTVSLCEGTFGIIKLEVDVDFFMLPSSPMRSAAVTDTVLGGGGGDDDDDCFGGIPLVDDSSSPLSLSESEEAVAAAALIIARWTEDTSTPPIGARTPRPVPLRVRRFILCDREGYPFKNRGWLHTSLDGPFEIRVKPLQK